MIDHVNLPVSDIAASKIFYDTLLATLGLRPLIIEPDVIGYGIDVWSFGIVAATCPIPSLHLAFKATSRQQVRAFHDMALRLGATSNGAPAQRDAYGPAYYAAFVIDPDGHNIEAVMRG